MRRGGLQHAVEIHVGALVPKEPQLVPLVIHACVGAQCADVSLVSSRAEATTCGAITPGSGPLVTCTVTSTGDVVIDLSLLSDPGPSPVVAVSVMSGSTLVASHAKQAALGSETTSGSDCPQTCREGQVTFTNQ